MKEESGKMKRWMIIAALATVGLSAMAANPWAGKKVAFLGDSITDPAQTNRPQRIYWQYLAEGLGLEPHSFKVGALNQIALLHDAEGKYANAFSIRNLFANAAYWDGKDGIVDYAPEYIKRSPKKKGGIAENSLSAGIRIHYGPFTVMLGNLPEVRRQHYAGRPFMKDILPVQGHSVFKVAPGGRTFDAFVLTDTDESMRILYARRFTSGANAQVKI